MWAHRDDRPANVVSRGTVPRAAATAAVVASPGCAAPLAAGDDDDPESSDDPVDDGTLVAVSDGDAEVEAITYDRVASAGDVRRQRQGDGYVLPITLTGEGVESLTDALETARGLEDPKSVEIRFYFAGELKRTLQLGPGLAAAISEGEFDGEFLLQVESRDEAERLRDGLVTS